MISFLNAVTCWLRAAPGVQCLKDSPCDSQAEQAGPDGRAAEKEEGGEETREAVFVFVKTCGGEDKECKCKDGTCGLS